ncbi:hypothetical protein ACQ4PT_019866 [Festuca glaucescens]
MAGHRGGRGVLEARGRGDAGAARGGNAGHGAQQGRGGAENFAQPPGFNNFFIGGPSVTDGVGGNMPGGFFNGAYPGVVGFQSTVPGFPGAAPFLGSMVYPGAPGYPFQGGPAVAPGFQAYAALPPQQMGFNAGTGFDAAGRGAAVCNRRRNDARGLGRGDSTTHGRGLGRGSGLGRGNVDKAAPYQEQHEVGDHQLQAQVGDVAVSQTSAGGAEAMVQPVPTLVLPGPGYSAAQAMPQMVAALSAAVADGLPTKRGKNLEKLKCNRCGLTGHIALGCTTMLCDFCEQADHSNANSPLHLAPKPQLRMYGWADEELTFFELPLTGSYKPKMENSRTARITIDGGVLTSLQIVTQLQRLVPVDDFHWDVRLTEDNSFRVLFPSKEELERLKVFGNFHVPNSACKMTVDIWGARLEPLYLLPEVWVRVHGLPSRPRGDYLALWAIGDWFGKTLEVGMPFTRQHGVVRLRLGCMDYTKIPESKHMPVKDGFYDLRFEVENVPMVVADADMLDANQDSGDRNDGNGFADDGARPEDQNDPNGGIHEKGNAKQNEGQGDVVVPKDTQTRASRVIFSPLVKSMIESAKREWAASNSVYQSNVQMDQTEPPSPSSHYESDAVTAGYAGGYCVSDATASLCGSFAIQGARRTTFCCFFANQEARRATCWCLLVIQGARRAICCCYFAIQGARRAKYFAAAWRDDTSYTFSLGDARRVLARGTCFFSFAAHTRLRRRWAAWRD